MNTIESINLIYRHPNVRGATLYRGHGTARDGLGKRDAVEWAQPGADGG